MQLDTSKTTWDLSPLFVSDQDPKIKRERKLVQKAINSFVQKWSKNEKYLVDPKVLKAALKSYESLLANYGLAGSESYYMSLRYNQNQLDTSIKAKVNKIQEFARDNQNKLQFFELELGKISKTKQKKFLSSSHLNDYRHFLEKLFRDAKYTLSDKEEKIMNLKASTARDNWKKMTSSFLSKEEKEVVNEKGKKVTLTFSELLPLLQSKNKKVRDMAAKAINEILKKHSDIAEHEINSILSDIKVNNKLRGRKRPDLQKHVSDDLNSKTVDTLVKSVEKKFSVSRDFYKFKAKLIKTAKLAYHERLVEYGDIDTNYSYKRSVNLVYNAYNKLDPEFAQIFANFVENGQIDAYPKKGKRNGAFCAYKLPTQPTYILLNFTNKLGDVLTLAHETGHGVNNEFMRSNQNALNFGTPLATAEIASTFFEGFVLQNIIENVDEKTKLALMVKCVTNDINTIIRQVAADLFQRELHEKFRKKGYLDKGEIGKLFQKHMKSYMGPAVKQSPGSENWWIHWHHIRSPFYNYQYAFGFLIAKHLLKIVNEDAANIEKVKYFLSAGMSESPKEIFAKIGIDISNKTFWDNGISQIETSFNETKKLAKKLDKI